LERTGRLEPGVDAVLRLASPALEGTLGEESLALACELAVAGVADRLAARMGAVREAERRTELTATIVRLGPPVAVAIGEALVRTEDRGARHAFTGALAGMGEKASDVLGTLVHDHRWFVVRNAVLVLGETREPWALPHLTRTLAHPDPRVRRETLIALARIGGEEAAKLVSGMLTDPEPNVREAAALAAGTLGARSAIEPLLATVRDGDDPGVEVAALRALGRLGAEAWVADLERKAKGSFLYRPPVDVRIAAYRVLATIDAPEARNVLRGGLHDRDEAVRTAVQELLRSR
jgi:HEAT repeat protein